MRDSTNFVTCDTIDQYIVPETEPKTGVSKLFSDAYDFLSSSPAVVPPTDNRWIWNAYKTPEQGCGALLDLSPEERAGADRIAEEMRLNGRFDNVSKENLAAMQDALKNGKMDDFITAVNLTLTLNGSQFRLANADYKERMTYTSESGAATAEKDNLRSNVVINDFVYNRPSDRLTVVYDPLYLGYKAAVASPKLD